MSVPRVFGLPHLSEDAVAAFADGVLSASAAARAARHCAECGECAEAVRIQRETTALLRSSLAPSLPSGLLDRLSGLPMTAPLDPPHGLPVVIGDGGVPMIRSHGVADEASGPGGELGREMASEPHHPFLSHPLRRTVVPIGLVASAAAVVAVGALGGHFSPSGHTTPANLTGVVNTSTPAGSGYRSRPIVNVGNSADPGPASASAGGSSSAPPAATADARPTVSSPAAASPSRP